MANVGGSGEPAIPVSTIEELMQDSSIPPREWKYIDPALWDKRNTTIDDNVSQIAASTHVARVFVEFSSSLIFDEELFYCFCEEMEGWTDKMFQAVHVPFLRELRRLLRHRGVYTGRINMSISKSLTQLLEQEKYPLWPDKSFRTEEFHPRTSVYRTQQRLLNGHPTAASQPDVLPPPITQTSRQQSMGGPFPPVVETVERTTPHPQVIGQQQLEQNRPIVYEGRQRSEWYDGARNGRNSTPAYPQPPGASVPPLPPPVTDDPYSAIPPPLFQNGKLDPAAIAIFVKMWDRDKKYSGKPYDLLDDKLKIFYSICFHADIRPNQFHAVFPRILTGRAEDYYIHYVDQQNDMFSVVYAKMKTHFDTDVNHSHYYTDWTTITFSKIRRENPDKALSEILEIMLDKLQLCQRALGPQYVGEYALRTTVITACRGVKELEMALFKPPLRCEELFGDLRSSIENSLAIASGMHMTETKNQEDEQFYLDRRFNNNSTRHRGLPSTPSKCAGRRNYESGSSNNGSGKQRSGFADKKCFVCQKTGCWSTNHTLQERKQAKSQYLSVCEFNDQEPDLAAYLAAYEGEETDLTTMSPEEGASVTHFLEDAAFLHHVTGQNVHNMTPDVPSSMFLIEDRYTRRVYQGILPDSGAANMSTVGNEQFLALQAEDPSLTLDESTAGDAQIKFGQGKITTSIGTVTVNTSLGKIDFHVLNAPTPFLLCLADMDRLHVYYNNTTDQMIQGNKAFPVIRKWGHPWFHLGKAESAHTFLSESELRRLHRRFGHPATKRLYQLLKRSGHVDVDESTLQEIKKFCHHCQTHSSAPHRFKFTLRDDCEFNCEILVDVLYLSAKPVLHVVDSATSFQGARFLASLSTKDTWEALRMLWIDTYQGPPDIITHDAGTNFTSAEFKTEAKMMGITCKQVPVEAHWSIGKLERYHAPLRRAFDIITAELGDSTTQEAILQMSIKAVNDTVGPNGLVPTLLVFGTYPRLTMDSPPSPSIIRRSNAIQKAMKELRKVSAERQVNDALNARNGPSTIDVLALPLQSEVLVWREKDGWQGPFKILNNQGHNITVDMVNGPTVFRSTVVRPYNRDDNLLIPSDATARTMNSDGPIPDSDPNTVDAPLPSLPINQPRKRGRPPGSKNKPKAQYLSKKELDDYELATKLREDGVITTPGDPFEESDAKEINDLVGRGVFIFELYDEREHGSTRIFKSRMVREVKGKSTKPYEKSRLVIQGYNDLEKAEILTQSPTIQRCSQRLITAIAPSLLLTGMKLQLRDITQAYPQAQTELFRTILSHLPKELNTKYPEGTFIRVIKPLYGIPEAGVHWYATYHSHHINELGMETSTYDPCLLITNGNPDRFGIIGMQTDDTLMLGTPAFSMAEEQAREKAQFRAKPKSQLTADTILEFNGCSLKLRDTTINLMQKGQGSKIETINPSSADRTQKYIEQRARGAYIASICQPEASFDLSVAAQSQQPSDDDIAKLNKRLHWQATNLERGLQCIPIDLSTAKLMIFADGSFANNHDLSSQLGFMIALVNETPNDDAFMLRGNLIHWSSTKCKRVTRSVLASEVYGIVNGFDVGIVLASTLRKITDQLNIPPIPLIVCTDSFSLYECLVKLGTTNEKRLMIDIMALRQSYERREISEIRWIEGNDNPADAFTKQAPNRALERFLDTNQLTIRVEGSVQRPAGKDSRKGDVSGRQDSGVRS